MYSVRGKRKKGTVIGEQVNVRHGKRGRPMKQAKSLAPSRRIVNAGLRNSQHDPDTEEFEIRSELSQLEQLPNEMLQLIFFYCFETSLPKASIHLARALSTELTYKVLILFAFFDDDCEHPVETKFFLPATYRPLDVAEKMRLQRNISSCHWFTLERIQNCLPALSWLAMLQAWHAERAEEAICLERIWIGDSTQLTVESGPSSSRDHTPLPQPDDIEAMKRHYSAAEGTSSSPKNSIGIESSIGCSLRIVVWRFNYLPPWTEPSSNRKVIKHQGPSVTVLAARVLPEWLLRGNPWTDQKLALLQLLRRGLQHIQRDYELQISASAVFEGMADAIQTKHLAALKTLLEIHDFANDGGASQPQSVVGEPTKNQLPARLFHLASRAGAEGSEIMWLLMRGDIYSLPTDDDILTGWALRRRMNGDEVAEIMLKHMAGTAEYQISVPRRPFQCGRGVAEGRFCTSTFRDELAYFEGEHGQYWPPHEDEDRYS